MSPFYSHPLTGQSDQLTFKLIKNKINNNKKKPHQDAISPENPSSKKQVEIPHF